MSKPKTKRPSNATLLSNWSKAVRQRDGNVCAVCGKAEYLNAHHILPKHLWKEFMLEADNGIALCPSHHRFGKLSAH